MPHPLVLVVDDEDLVRNTISHWLAHSGFQPLEAENGSVAIDMLQHHEPEVALVDLVMPDLSGLEVTRQIKNLSPDVEVIILTGYPTLETTLAAIREQVFDYVCKPPEMQALMRTVARAVERRGLLRQNRDLIRQLELERNGLKTQVAAAHRALEKRIEMSHQLIGQSESMVQVRRLIAEVAPSDMTVLLRGESGTGKDTAARMINQLSGRENTGNFLKIN